METFDLILCDPPWRYGFSKSRSRKVENHYPTMTVNQIVELGSLLPIAENAVLFLWTTAPKLMEGLKVLGCWGFVYKTGMVWDKEVIGMGYWARGQHEHLLVGVKGRYAPPRPEHRRSSIFTEGRGRHSAKPLCVYEWIERAFPKAKKLEVFARNRRPGWSAYGNEIVSDIALLGE